MQYEGLYKVNESLRCVVMLGWKHNSRTQCSVMPAGTHRRLSRSVSLSRCFKAVGYAETFFCSHSCFSLLVDVSGLIVVLCVLTFFLSLYLSIDEVIGQP